MIEIIKKSRQVEHVRYSWVFQRVGASRGTGFGFSVDEDGDLLGMEGAAADNLLYALDHPDEYIDEGIEEYRWVVNEPTIGRCSCGEEVVLDGFTNTCECGIDYNWAGQQLAPRYLWGEETGEHWADIARIP